MLDQAGCSHATHASQLGAEGGLRVHSAKQQQIAAAVARVQAVLAEGRYLHLPYTTLFEYLTVRPLLWSHAAAAALLLPMREGLRPSSLHGPACMHP